MLGKYLGLNKSELKAEGSVLGVATDSKQISSIYIYQRVLGKGIKQSKSEIYRLRNLRFKGFINGLFHSS